MLVQKLEQLLNEIRQRRNKYEFVKIQQAEKERTMPMGKGTYGSKKGRPPKAAKKMATPIKKKPIKKKK
jgi:hypothetical protein